MTIAMISEKKECSVDSDEAFITRVMQQIESLKLGSNPELVDNYTRGGSLKAGGYVHLNLPTKDQYLNDFKSFKIKAFEKSDEMNIWQSAEKGKKLANDSTELDDIRPMAAPISPKKEEIKTESKYLFETLYAGSKGKRMVKAEVGVPNSQFVSEIVGKQGEKIKRLRKETKTCIQTPTKNQPPVFKITGYIENVEAAKNRIEAIVDHLIKIRSQNIEIEVNIPDHLTGLVIGKKGATINAIREATKTYVVSPKRPDTRFKITGKPEDCLRAKLEIEELVKERAGVIVDTKTGQITDYVPNHANYLMEILSKKNDFSK